jgi:protein-disulfide isomerase
MSRTKRSEVKIRRQQARASQRRLIIIAVVISVIALAGVIGAANLYENTRPVGEVIDITERQLPQKDGQPYVTMNGIGDPNAPVKIEVFEDFQCPACQSFSETTESLILSEMRTLIEEGKVYYTFRHYPFIDDRMASKESDQSANAAMCAGEQGMFWEMHDIIFANWDGENEGAFADRRLAAFAEQIGLEMESWQECFDDKRYYDQIQDDFSEGARRGVSGTPTVFVNGSIVNPGFVPSFEEIQTAVNAALP